ncbi:MAG TPA: TIGR00725 family protein [Solirubrobacteraceae bacterium]|nr:TIGR00725 family protein [Solirubrobacteraceae bacterium]
MHASEVPYIAVVGASEALDLDLVDAEEVGRLLGAAGAVVVCGGRGGVMEAASRGAAASGGTVIGMLPGDDRSDANDWVTIAIPTGLGELRNGLIVRSADAMVAVGGAYGTLSEVALGLHNGLKVYGLHTWGIDGIESVESPEEAVEKALSAARARA